MKASVLTHRWAAITVIAGVSVLCSGCGIIGIGGLGVNLTGPTGVVSAGVPIILTVKVTNTAGCQLTGQDIGGTQYIPVFLLPFIDETAISLDEACAGIIGPDIYQQAQAAQDSIASQLQQFGQSIAQTSSGNLPCVPYASTPFGDLLLCGLPLPGPLAINDTVEGTVVVTPPRFGRFRGIAFVAAAAPVTPNTCITVVNNNATPIATGIGCDQLLVGAPAPTASNSGLAMLAILLAGFGLLAVRRVARPR